MSYALNTVYYDVLVLSACHYSALTWVAYDIILTLPQELEVVWRRGWTLGKVCYLLTRYYSLITLVASAIAYSRISDWNDTLSQMVRILNVVGSSISSTPTPSDNSCRGSIIGPISVDMMLILRLHALYDKNKKLLAFLLLLWTTETALILAVSIHSLSEMQYTPMPAHVPIPNCGAADTQNFVKTSYSWIFGLIVQFIFFMLTLYKYIQSIRAFGDYGQNGRSLLQVVRQTKNYAPLVTLFIRDGTFTFFATFVAVFMSLLFFTFLGHTILGLMGTPWMLAIVAVAASRMYLSLGGYLHHVDEALEDLGCYVEGSGLGLVGSIEPATPAEGVNGGPLPIPDQRRRTFAREDSSNSLEHMQAKSTSLSIPDFVTA